MKNFALSVRSGTLAILMFGLFALPLTGCSDTDTAADASPGNAGESAAATDDQAALPENSDTPMTPTVSDSNYYAIDTPKGRMVVALYDDTPGHRDNFKKLAGEDFYDGTAFHRVIQGFMIQGGDPNSKDDDPMNDGQGGPGYTLEAEIKPYLFNRRGALVAARMPDQVNPERRSSGSQFYIVHGGSPIEEGMLARMQMGVSQSIGEAFEFSEEAREAYMTEGGAPWLDRQYTVFGELVEGFDVLDSIATVSTPRARGEQGNPALADRPAEPITMSVEHLPDYDPSDAASE